MPRRRRNRSAFLLTCLCLVAGAAWTFHAAAGDDPVRIAGNRTLAAPVKVENLTVWPVVTDTPRETGKYLTLPEAQAKGLAEVREKGTGAEVNQLVLLNKSDLPIFVPGGTVVQGGKQDRQLAQDLVVAPGKEVPVDAFCIEHGRWTTVQGGKDTNGAFKAREILAAKRIRSSGQYAGNQSQVWAQVDVVNEKSRKMPATSTFMATVDEDDKAALALRKRMEEEVGRYFADLGEKGVVGFAYAVNGEPMAMRVFANPELFAAHFGPFLKTFSLEAQVAQERDRSAGRPLWDAEANVEGLLKMVQGISEAKSVTEDTPGLNRNSQQANGWGGHGACLVPSPKDGKDWVALTEDWTAPAEFGQEERLILKKLKALGYTE